MAIKELILLLLCSCSLSMGSNASAQLTAAGADAQAGDATTGLPALHETLPVPVAVEPTAEQLDRSRGQEWHRVSLRLAGSMCPACLLELEGKIQRLPGVRFAKVDWRNATSDSSNGHQDQPQPGKAEHRTAASVVIFDANAIKLDRIEHLVKREKYKPLDILDAPY